MKIHIATLFLIFFIYRANGQNTFNNDICVPETLYMLEGVQNDIFVEPLIKRWRPFNDIVRFSGSADFSRVLQRVASIDTPVDGAEVRLSLVNQDEFKTVKSLSAKVLVGKPNVGNDTIAVSIIGDSFTNGGFFIDALLDKGYVPKIKMIGLREVTDHPGQFDEGRGGWTLGRYFSVSKDRTIAYNGFWQPEGKYKYWGSTSFWMLANDIGESRKEDWSFNEHYNASRYNIASLNFNNKNGYKQNPKKDDLMYDNEQDSYILYDGKKWNKASYKDFNWSFNYGKYLSMWNLHSPKILVEFLGLNDFRNANLPGEINFTTWNTRIEEMIESYLSAVPDGKFVLMIPSSSCGILDNRNGDFTTKQNACMWELRKNIIGNFDNRTDEQIYIVDAGTAIDNLYGTRFLTDSTFTKPFSEYPGKESIEVQEGNPHPYPNYPTLGVSLAAFIQKYREDFQTQNKNTAIIPSPKLENDSYDWWLRHEEVLRIKDSINPEVVLIGNSITHFWGGLPKLIKNDGSPFQPRGPKAWDSVFGNFRVLNLGFGWDRTQNVLWRIENGEMDGLSPKYAVIHIGTNNTSQTKNARKNTALEISEGVKKICEMVKIKSPKTKIVLMGIMPREQYPSHPRRILINETNKLLQEIAQEQNFQWLDISSQLLDEKGVLSREIASDFCHLTAKGYQIWANKLRPILNREY